VVSCDILDRSVIAWTFSTMRLMLFFDGRNAKRAWPAVRENICPKVNPKKSNSPSGTLQIRILSSFTVSFSLPMIARGSDQARRYIAPTRHLAHNDTGFKGRRDNRLLLLDAPPPPTLGTGQYLDARHCTVSCIGAKTSACTNAYQPDQLRDRKTVLAGGLLLLKVAAR
jgi:hypothetical protein